MRTPPDWYVKVAAALATGMTQQAAAKGCGVSVRSLRRHLDAPDGLLRGLVDQERAKVTEKQSDELGQLRGKALAVLEAAIDRGDLAAAKAVLGRLVPPVDAPPPPDEPEAEISVEDAYREVALALPSAADLARTGVLSPEVIEMFRAACKVLLADDLQPRTPIDVEAERVEVGALTPMKATPSNRSEDVASVIPIRP